MKVVLFCGGLGTRMREYSETIPKALVDIGYRPIIWHLMKYYGHFGHREFILCLGYRGDLIKNYFLNYDECLSNDFDFIKGGKEIRLYNSDIGDWTISFVDTGLNSNIGQRLRAVERYLEGEDVFLANYSDGLTDLNLDDFLSHFRQSQKTASFVCVQPSQSFHVVNMGDGNLVEDIIPVDKANLWINGGFFAFKHEIFDYMQEGEELVHEPFQRLIKKHELITYQHNGFWACMDTFKEKKMFDDMYAKGEMPWAVWQNPSKGANPILRTMNLEEKTLLNQPVTPVSNFRYRDRSYTDKIEE
jgi:glucose-1-phosphate cytidylyltransferase